MEANLKPIIHVIIRAVSHPAMRQTAACVARVLAAGESGIVCTLDTSPNFEPGGETISVYLRTEATDALALTLTAELREDPRLREACATMSALDDRCREMFRITWESLLANPQNTLSTLADYLKIALSNEAQRTLDREITTLRNAVGRYDHPLPFIAALDGAPQDAAWTDRGLCADISDAGVSHLLGAKAPRKLLIVIQSDYTTVPVPVATPSDWQVFYLVIGDDGSLAAADAAAELGIIYFHEIDAAPAIGLLIDSLVPRLANGGLLCGKEASDSAVGSVVARLTGGGDQYRMTFILSGHRWLAFTPTWWR